MVTTQQTKDPWSGVQPYITTGLESVKQNVLNTPKEYYPNSTVVPLSNQTEQALTGIENRANAGAPIMTAASGQLQRSLRGDYLNPNSNPYLQAGFDRINQTVLPQLDARFEASGRSGSPLAQRAASQGLTDAMGTLMLQNYNTERTNMSRDAALAPSIEAGQYLPQQMLQSVGQAREGQAGLEMTDAVNRFNFAQNEPGNRVAQYMALVNGGSYGGTSTNTQPVFNQPGWQTGLGAAASGAGILGSLYGGQNPLFQKFW